MRYYVLSVEGGINAEVVGPFADEGSRDAKGAEIHASQDPETDATFALDVDAQGVVTVSDAVSFGDEDES